jgi:hypothetical protein
MALCGATRTYTARMVGLNYGPNPSTGSNKGEKCDQGWPSKGGVNHKRLTPCWIFLDFIENVAGELTHLK